MELMETFKTNTLHLPMNLFFSSLAMRTAKARPIPEEQPVMRTTFWFIVSQSDDLASLSKNKAQEPQSSSRQDAQQRWGAGEAQT